MAHILVTGGAGYIGSIMVPMLLEAGHEVIALDNFMYRQNSLLDCCHYPNLTVVRGDARDDKLIKQLLSEDINFVLPLACIVGATACDKDPAEAKSVNLEAIRMLLRIRGNSHIIFPNTNSGYGIGPTGSYCDETSPLNPISLYGKLKVEAEREILRAGNSITLRLATVFGISPRMRIDLLVNDFVYRAVNDRFVILFQSHFKRNYIHVRDVVRTFFHCMNRFHAMKNSIYNVGLSSANLSKWELCEEIKKQLPDFYFVEAEIGEDVDKRNYIVSSKKLEATGFLPIFSLPLGISELIKGYQIIKNSEYANI